LIGFFRPFRGNFTGVHYDAASPTPIFLTNSSSCKGFANFVSETLLDRIVNGSMKVLGKLGHVPPPLLVLPLTIEPTKPRLCHDARFLNLWTKDNPFSLETLKDIPRIIEKGSYMTTCDEKSGYDHVLLQEDSRQYFGLCWAGWLLTYTTISFGWKASPFIYQTIGQYATGFIRSLLVNCLQYIDDRLIASYVSKNKAELSGGISINSSYLCCLPGALTLGIHYFFEKITSDTR
jgi:hypothetical protein